MNTNNLLSDDSLNEINAGSFSSMIRGFPKINVSDKAARSESTSPKGSELQLAIPTGNFSCAAFC